jgi:hypothetical protein
MQGVQAAERATSEPARFDMLMSQRQNGRDTPSTTSQLPEFDWEDFEARYERALEDADEHEGEILKEAESLSKVSHPTLHPMTFSQTSVIDRQILVLSRMGICCIGTG